MMRTGTNYILSLIEMNFKDAKVFLNLGGWKHGNLIRYPDEKELFEHVDVYAKSRERKRTDELIKLFQEEKVNFLIHVKNPYLWIVSMINLGESKEMQPVSTIHEILRVCSVPKRHSSRPRQS